MKLQHKTKLKIFDWTLYILGGFLISFAVDSILEHILCIIGIILVYSSAIVWHKHKDIR